MLSKFVMLEPAADTAFVIAEDDEIHFCKAAESLYVLPKELLSWLSSEITNILCNSTTDSLRLEPRRQKLEI